MVRHSARAQALPRPQERLRGPLPEAEQRRQKAPAPMAPHPERLPIPSEQVADYSRLVAAARSLPPEPQKVQARAEAQLPLLVPRQVFQTMVQKRAQARHRIPLELEADCLRLVRAKPRLRASVASLCPARCAPQRQAVLRARAKEQPTPQIYLVEAEQGLAQAHWPSRAQLQQGQMEQAEMPQPEVVV